jgi:hypothetical protein
MIVLTDSPAEQTTAATNIVLAVGALAAIVVLARLQEHDAWKAAVWIAVSACLVAGSLLAAIAHGLELSAGMDAWLWILIYLCLGLVVAGFVVGAVHDLWGERCSRKAAPIMVVVAALFLVVSQRTHGFLVFVIYEALFMGLALMGYGYLDLTRRLPGAWLLCAGILVTLIAAALQATRAVPPVTLVGAVFDHNGVFHVLQVTGLVLMLLGLRTALRAERSSAD